MPLPLPGGVVSDPATQQNFDAIAAHLPFPNVIELGEQTAPPSPSANRVRIYAKDDGAGKTQLIALFPTGAEQVLATEP